MLSEPHKISKEFINALPLQAYEGPTCVIDNDEDLPQAVDSLRMNHCLGFDTETRPAFKKGENYPPALLQLASADNVYLFQLLKLKKIRPLWQLLADPQFLKVGVAIQDDVRKLQERRKFNPAGFVEISDITSAAGILNTGLRSLAAMFLDFRISKGAQVSNWAKSTLSEVQIQYAATDAWVSRELYLHLAGHPTFSKHFPKHNPHIINGKANRIAKKD